MTRLTQDPRNANRGTVRGRGMLEESLRSYGAGRAPVVSADGVILAGNKTVEVAQELGIPVQEIESDGKTLYVIRRTDLPYDDPRAAELAIADNRVGQVSLDWDTDALQEVIGQGADVRSFWFDDELADLIERGSTGGGGGGSGPDDEPENPYTTKAETPVYSPTMETPPLVIELYDGDRRDRLVADIMQADLEPGVAAFLVEAAHRHVVFDYQAIAEFYAHASPEVQRLMEDSALVIIDFDRAIELGYARARARFLDMIEEAPDDDDDA